MLLKRILTKILIITGWWWHSYLQCVLLWVVLCVLL